jgi:hypothetical protein
LGLSLAYGYNGIRDEIRGKELAFILA